ncbi:hypothetical protein DERP_003937 [Dermatophagoides pteronyssinus]|uniref:RING-type domain-containing protein n=1 Tax=Dermatophagoides pteronyssinus TaxID=6956 RepID=A0ABQ8J7N3_DERPT|nr:hypothetical protein DERP_003937 [Dermatophagoides pteronyssinus]
MIFISRPSESLLWQKFSIKNIDKYFQYDELIYDTSSSIIIDNNNIDDDVDNYRRKKFCDKNNNNPTFEQFINENESEKNLVIEMDEKSSTFECLISANNFWQSFYNHFKILFITAIDLNLIYGSLLMIIFYLMPITINEQYSFEDDNDDEDSILIQTNQFLINLTRFDLNFLINFLTTGLIITFIRWKILTNDADNINNNNDNENSDQLFNVYHDHVSLFFNYFQKLFHYINVFLFRKSQNTHRNRYDRTQYSSISNRMSLSSSSSSLTSMIYNDDQYVSQDDDDDDEEFLSETDDIDTIDMDMEFDMDMDRILLERLFAGSPNLWLQTELISNDYLNKLPVWNYQEPDDDDEEEESSLSSTMLIDYNQNFIDNQCCTSSSLSSSSSSSSESSDDNDYLDCLKQTILNLSKSKQSTSSSSSNINIKNNDNYHDDNDDIIVHDIILSKTKDLRKKVFRKRRSNDGIRSNHKSKQQEQQQQQQQQQQPVKESNNYYSTYRPEWMIDQRDCTVCLEPYESEQIIMGLACGHNYHQPCIAQWLCRGNHRCPICRWPSYRLQHPRQYQYQKNQQQQQQQMLFKHNQYRTTLNNDIS